MAFTPDGVLLATVTAMQDATAPGQMQVVAINVVDKVIVSVLWTQPKPPDGYGLGKGLIVSDVTTWGTLVAVAVTAPRLGDGFVQLYARVASSASTSSTSPSTVWAPKQVLAQEAEAVRFSPCGSQVVCAFGQCLRFCGVVDGAVKAELKLGPDGPYGVHTLEMYMGAWLVADVSGCMCVVTASDAEPGEWRYDRISHGTRPKALASVPGVGVFVLNLSESVVLLRPCAKEETDTETETETAPAPE
jgi:hypothetical protein